MLEVKIMKGVITIKSKEKGIFSGITKLKFSGVIKLKSDKLLKDFKLKGKGGKLKILARSDHPENLNGIIVLQTNEKQHIANIAFSFPTKISEIRKKYRATCLNYFTHQFAPWSVFFRKTG